MKESPLLDYQPFRHTLGVQKSKYFSILYDQSVGTDHIRYARIPCCGLDDFIDNDDYSPELSQESVQGSIQEPIHDLIQRITQEPVISNDKVFNETSNREIADKNTNISGICVKNASFETDL